MGLALKLIVGLGNPGEEYARTRHNAGVWFLSRFAELQGVTFKLEKKFHGRTALTHFGGHEIRLLVPTTYMNESGKAVGAISHFYRIAPEEILIAHDELDLPTGAIRYKEGGGLAGHNGLRDVTRSLGGQQSFNRLRIGVGHPGNKENVTGHVLGKVNKQDESVINECIEESLRYLPLAADGDWQQAMTALNGFKP